MSANPVSAAATVKSRDLPITGRCRRISSAIPMAMSCSMPALSSAIGRTIRSQPRSSSEDRSKPKGMASRVLTRISPGTALGAQSPCRLPRSGFAGGLPEARGQHPDSTRLGGLGPHGVGGHVAAAFLECMTLLFSYEGSGRTVSEDTSPLQCSQARRGEVTCSHGS